MGQLMFIFEYSREAIWLCLTGRITARTLIYGLRHRPVALAGRKVAYIVDPDFSVGD
jgi:hypothetical protein